HSWESILQDYLKHHNSLISIYSFTFNTSAKSSINVSLTYLRGLEIPELTEDDMLVIYLIKNS
ncbi:hypothetical protein N9H73_05675, partial [Flavobacteriaceae bacterium]|nr:hypothetical protein [Flavobacteriaceae bacterium]